VSRAPTEGGRGRTIASIAVHDRILAVAGAPHLNRR
jgi:hypothetical protein